MFEPSHEKDPEGNPFPLLRSGPVESIFEAIVVALAAVAILLLLMMRTRSHGFAVGMSGVALLVGIAAAAAVIVVGIARIVRRDDDRGLFATGVLLFALSQFARSSEIPGLVRLLPAAPAVLIVWAFVRVLHRADELQRRIVNQALAFGFVVAFISALGYSLLEKAGLPRSGAGVWFLVLFVGFWIGLAGAAHRYRE